MGYLSASKTFSHQKYGLYVGSSGEDYKKVYYQFSYNITIAGNGTISYTITSKSNVKDALGWNGCSLSAWINISDTGGLNEDVLVAGYYRGDDTFPRTVGSTLTGTLTGKATKGVVTVSSKILVGSNYANHSPTWNGTSLLNTTSITRDSYTNVTATAPTITDNKDSTFTITATAGTAGTNNKVNSTSLYYRIGSSGSYTKHSSLTLANKALTAADNEASQTVYAYTTVDGVYNDATSATVSKSIKKYAAPGKPINLAISYSKSRLTLKESWTYTWTAANAANSSSPVKGYRIRIWKNNAELTGLSCSGDTITKTSGTNEYIDRESTSCKLVFDPVSFGFKVGDTVEISLNAYTKNALNTKLFGARVYSDSSTVQNAGIVDVKVGGKWKEGQVYVKVGGKWREAQSVQTKVKGVWKEST